MEASNLLRSEDDVTTSLIESIPSQNDVINLESEPKGFIPRVWNWLKKQDRFVILAEIVLAASWFYSWLHPPTGPPLGGAVVEDKIMMVFLLVILVVSLSGILSGNLFLLWVLNLLAVCIMCFQKVSYLQEIAEMSPDISVDPMTLFWSCAPMLLGLLYSFINTVYFIKYVVLKATTTTRNSDTIDVEIDNHL
ncbi:hypothetical protein SSX86_008938 [Deinandra increscens subsp. villosa]|uniref:Uncharacterized protein n=1 Tax=Deinandra increscens subsp. villosa TaxID=3103831 RepID=A0AAP0DK11_9ASTR